MAKTRYLVASISPNGNTVNVYVPSDGPDTARARYSLVHQVAALLTEKATECGAYPYADDCTIRLESSEGESSRAILEQAVSALRIAGYRVLV